jgi:hypothetical protein
VVNCAGAENETPRRGWNDRRGVLRVEITIQRATGFPPLAPIPLNANSLEGQSLTRLTYVEFALAMVKALLRGSVPPR